METLHETEVFKKYDMSDFNQFPLAKQKQILSEIKAEVHSKISKEK